MFWDVKLRLTQGIFIAFYLERKDGWRQRVIDWAMTKLPGSIEMTDGEVFVTRSSLRNALHLL